MRLSSLVRARPRRGRSRGHLGQAPWRASRRCVCSLSLSAQTASRLGHRAASELSQCDSQCSVLSAQCSPNNAPSAARLHPVPPVLPLPFSPIFPLPLRPSTSSSLALALALPIFFRPARTTSVSCSVTAACHPRSPSSAPITPLRPCACHSSPSRRRLLPRHSYWHPASSHPPLPLPTTHLGHVLPATRSSPSNTLERPTA